MATTRFSPGEVIDVRPLGASVRSAATSAIAKTEKLELIRLVVPAGKVIPPHRAPSEITVHCLEGRIAFTALGKKQELSAGQMLYLSAAEEHSLEGIEDASVLVTLLR